MDKFNYSFRYLISRLINLNFLIHRRKMSLHNLKELLLDAKERKYGIIAANPFNFDSFEVVLSAAEEKKSPIILQVCDKLFKYFNFDKLMHPIISLAKEATIPVAINLDHGENIEIIMKSIKAGVTSVMYDGSSLPLENNISLVKEITRFAHTLNISVEGEVGIVKGYEVDSQNKVFESKEEYLTKVEDAIKFVNETEVDALAIAVGTAHGVYKSTPKINYDRILEIKNAIEVPLVMHGGSGLSNNVYKKVIANGITKINYFTDLVIIATKKVEELISNKSGLNYMESNYLSMQAIKEDIKDKLDVFGSTGKA